MQIYCVWYNTSGEIYSLGAVQTHVNLIGLDLTFNKVQFDSRDIQ